MEAHPHSLVVDKFFENEDAVYAYDQQLISVGGSLGAVMAHSIKSNSGWYVEELPFYWENTSSLILNYYDLFYDLAEKPKILKTLPSTLNDNIRMSNIKAEINLVNKTVSFDVKVSLSGQYSKMIRFMYLSGVVN